MYYLICFVDGMLVGTIQSSVIPRVGESIHVDKLENSLLEGQTWDVLHVNYSYREMSSDYLNQIRLTLIETKTVTGGGFLSSTV
jgi:hypothetical protein